MNSQVLPPEHLEDAGRLDLTAETIQAPTWIDTKAIIRQTLAFLHPGGETFELCIIGAKQGNNPYMAPWSGRVYGKDPIVAGWFRDHAKAAELAVRVYATGVFVTLNPCQESLLARANERLKAQVERTKDVEISRTANMLIDLDPIRPAGISSTNGEHEAALEMAQLIKSDLEGEGWPTPLVGDSGNGGHLVYPLDMVRGDDTAARLKSVLAGLAVRYADHLVRLNIELDQKVFNPARLTKLYGTMVKKGDNTPDRPHRLARIISLPDTRQAVPLDLLKKMAITIPSQEKTQAKNIEAGMGRLDVDAYLKHYGVEVVMVKSHGGGFLYCLRVCLFDPSHNGNEAAIGQTAEGMMYYQCFHNSCKGCGWAEARATISGQDKLTEFIIGATHPKNSNQYGSKEQTKEEGQARPSEPPPQTAPLTPWGVAAQLFPRIPFPWEVLPGDIADSLQQLGRACATSPYALPGAAFCMVGSIMGRTVVVSPKEGWEAPLIIWHMDIRGSGDGKTPPVRLMAGPLHEAQRKAELCYREAMDAYKRLPRRERDKQPPPAPPRGYFVSDLTLEGLRDDLVNSPHGGILGIHDEISAFLSAQNQYKPKGTDREAWLLLYDGHSSRIVRAGRTIFLDGGRVSIFGGVQPRVFKTFFGGEDGLYLEDGTLYRFLATCEPSTYYDLTAESWGDLDRAKWEMVLHRAIAWVDEKINFCGGKIEKPTLMIFDSEAQTKFLEWRNNIYSFKDQLPDQLRGFLPKAIEYVLRLTGVIHCMQMFSIGSPPQLILSVEDLERGIKAVSFYMGQIQGAIRLIEEEGYAPPEISERSLLLAKTLDQLRPHLENGRLAIGFIHKHYNLIAPKTHKVGTPKGMGAVLRAVKLTISPGKHDANGHRGAKCLTWDKGTEDFTKQCLQCLQRQQSQEWQEAGVADDEEPMSASSAASDKGFESNADISEKMSASEIFTSSGFQDSADIADIMEVEI